MMDESAAPAAPPAQDQEQDRALALAYLTTVDIETVSRKAVLAALKEEHGRDFDKELVYDVTNEFMKNHLEAVSQAAEGGEGAKEEDQEEEGDAEPDVEFPEEWKARFDEVVWVKTSAQWPWYPAIILNPFQASKEAQIKGLKMIGKRHVICYYKNEQCDFAAKNQMKPFLEAKDQCLEQLQVKKYARFREEVMEGAAIAEEDVSKAKEERMSGRFPVRVFSKKRKKRVPMSAPRAERAEGAPAASSKLSKPAKSAAGLNIPRPAGPPGASGSGPESVATPATKKPKAKPKPQPAASSDEAPNASETKPANKKRPAPPADESDDEAEFDFDDEKEDRDDDYEDKPAAKKSKSASSSSASSESKKRKLDEKRTKHLDEKKAKKSKSSDSTNGKSHSSKPAKQKSSSSSSSSSKQAPMVPLKPSRPAVVAPVETNEMRAKRMLGLLGVCSKEEQSSGSSAALQGKILKYLDKLQQMVLTLDELRSTHAAEVVTQWRKHADPAIAAKASAVRSAWKERAQQTVRPAGVPSNAPSPAAGSLAPALAPTAVSAPADTVALNPAPEVATSESAPVVVEPPVTSEPAVDAAVADQSSADAIAAA